MHLEALGKDIRELFPFLNRFPEFSLAGGTALALQIGHRVSDDLDLFSERPIPKTLFQRVKRFFIGKPVIVSVNTADELTVFVRNGKITFLHYPFRRILKSVTLQGVSLFSIKEIAATKAYVIGRRGVFKDYVDIYFLLHGGYCTLDEMLSLATRKYGGDFHERLFLEQLLLVDEAEDTKVQFLKKPVTQAYIKEYLVAAIKKMKLS